MKAKTISSGDVDALIAAEGDNSGAGMLLFDTGYKLDVDAAIVAHADGVGDPR